MVDEVIVFKVLYQEFFVDFIVDSELVDKFIIVLFVGSRKQEIKDNLFDMIWVVLVFFGYQFVLVVVLGIFLEYYVKFVKGMELVVIFDWIYCLF